MANGHDHERSAAADWADEERAEASMKAWRIICLGFPGAAIYIAASRAAAKAKCQRHAIEVGWKIRWTEITAVRAPEYDEWASRQSERRQSCGILEEYVLA